MMGICDGKRIKWTVSSMWLRRRKGVVPQNNTAMELSIPCIVADLSHYLELKSERSHLCKVCDLRKAEHYGVSTKSILNANERIDVLSGCENLNVSYK